MIRVRNQHRKKNAAVLAGMILLLFLTAWSYTQMMDKKFHEYAQDTLSEISTRQLFVFKSQVSNSVDYLKSLALVLGGKEYTISEAKELVRQLADKSPFHKFAFADLNGNAYTLNEKEENIAQQPHFLAALQGETYISVPTYSISDRNETLLPIATPVYNQHNEIYMVLVGIYVVDEISGLVNTPFDDKSEVVLLNSHGDLILSRDTITKNINLHQDYFENLGTVRMIEGSKTQMLEDMRLGKSGNISFWANENVRYAHYEPTGINDWYMCVYYDYSDVVSCGYFDTADMFKLAFGLIFFVLMGYFLIEEKRHSTQLKKVAYFDELTGLPNEKQFKKEINNILKEDRQSQYFCIIFDICNFKFINDYHSHQVGDEVLLQCAKLLTPSLEDRPSKLFSIARLHSDVFAVFVSANNLEEEEKRKIKLIDSLREKITAIEYYKLDLYIGLYAVKEEDTANSAVEKALVAHSYSKEIEQNKIFVYDEAFVDERRKAITIQNEFEPALENEELQVYLQPQYNVYTSQMSGAEALVRWVANEKVKYYPNEFIPVLENSRKIAVLDRYIRNQVCKLLQKWKLQGLHLPSVSVNVSRLELLEEGFVERVTALVNRYDLNPSVLHLEITESAYVENAQKLTKVVEKLREQGFVIEMDDFGSGYSSLNVLKDVPVDVIKLDLEFMKIGEDAVKGGNILTATVRMVQSIGLESIAEGVEKKEQVDYLKSIGCTYVQGYYFAKPMPSAEFEKLLCKEKYSFHPLNADDISINKSTAFLDAVAQGTVLLSTFKEGAAIVEYTDDELRLVRLNDRFYIENGRKVGDNTCFGSNMILSVCPQDRRLCEEKIKQAIKTGEEVQVEVKHIPANKEDEAQRMAYCLRFLSKSGNSYIGYLSCTNITKQKNSGADTLPKPKA